MSGLWFVADRTHDGRPLQILTVIDEYSRDVWRSSSNEGYGSDDVLECLAGFLSGMGFRSTSCSTTAPTFTARRSDNG